MVEGTSRAGRISVVIRCFNEEKHLGRLLESLGGQTVRPAEILIVDSGSTDRSLAIAARYPARVVRIDSSEFTFGRSLNRGCAAATGDVLVLASAHVYPVGPDWLERLTEPLSDPGVGLVYGRQAFLGVEVVDSSAFGSGTNSSGPFGDPFGFGFGFGPIASTPNGAPGVVIAAVDPKSPAARARLASGDVITAISGHATPTTTALSKVVRAHRPGQVLALTVSTTNGTRTVRVRLGKGPID